MTRPDGYRDLPLGNKVGDLCLSTRTVNCLRVAGIHTVGMLEQLRSVDILCWPNAGLKTLREIMQLLDSLGLALSDDGAMQVSAPPQVQLDVAAPANNAALDDLIESFDLSTRTTNVLRAEKITTIGQLASLRSIDIRRMPNASRKTLLEIENLLASVGLTLVDGAPVIPQLEVLPVAESVKYDVLEDELRAAVQKVCNDRNADVLLKLWGWGGKAPRTLESVGREFEITRERVRQIQKKALNRLAKHDLHCTLLQEALEKLYESAPDLEASLGKVLHQSGISSADFHPQGIRVAAGVFGLDWPFATLTIGRRKIIALEDDAPKYRQAILLVGRKTSERGCVNIATLLSELDLSEADIPKLRRVLQAVPESRWLDSQHEWLYSVRSSRNRLANLCSKVLGVAPRIHISELRHAVSKSRRLAMCPPQRILEKFVMSKGLASVLDSIVSAKPGAGVPLPEESKEAVMLRVLDEYGPVMDGEDFEEKCIEAGMNAITYYLYRSRSPVICALGKGVYCKVGADVPPGTVEQIVANRRTPQRIADHGWTSDGRLWFGNSLTRQVITAGSICVPTFVSELVQGNWRVLLPDGSESEEVTCRDSFVWSFRKPFIVLGAEPGDLAAFEFDLKARKLWVSVGGPSLFEELQNASHSNVDDELEDS